MDPLEYQVARVKRFDPSKGKTGKGHLYIMCYEGGNRVVDVEDIIAVNSAPLRAKSVRKPTSTKSKKK